MLALFLKGLARIIFASLIARHSSMARSALHSFILQSENKLRHLQVGNCTHASLPTLTGQNISLYVQTCGLADHELLAHMQRPMYMSLCDSLLPSLGF